MIGMTKSANAATTDGLTFSNNQSIITNGLDVDTSPGAKTTVEFWMYWNGDNNEMPFSWTGADYSLYLSSGLFGFNTNHTDITGIDNADLINRWVYVSAVFVNDAPNLSNVKLYIDGQLQTLKQSLKNRPPSSNTVSSTGQIGQFVDGKYGFGGQIRDVSIFNGERTASEIKEDMNGITEDESGLIGYWKLDPITTSQVYDMSAHHHDGQGQGFDSTLDLTTHSVSDIDMNLGWTGYPGVTYTLNRDGTNIYQGTSNVYQDDPLTSGTAYHYTLSAKDANGESLPKEQTFSTEEGSLDILSTPTLSFQSTRLNGQSQTLTGTLTGQLIVKDTRKIRTSWHIDVSADLLQDADGHTLPSQSLQLLAPQSAVLNDGSGTPPTLTQNAFNIDDKAVEHTIVSQSNVNAFGVYSINFNGIKLNLKPSKTFVNKENKQSTYQTVIHWRIVDGH